MSRQSLVLRDFPSARLARTLSPNGRAGWPAQRAATRTVAGYVVAAVRAYDIQPVPPPATVRIVYTRPTRRERDPDNWSTGVTKALLDALRRCGILAGDDAARLQLAPVELRVARGVCMVEVELGDDGG